MTLLLGSLLQSQEKDALVAYYAGRIRLSAENLAVTKDPTNRSLIVVDIENFTARLKELLG